MGKRCPGCGEVKALDAFYRTARQVLTLCKACHNARCVARVRANPGRRAQQQQAKKLWAQRHPLAKARHEGRTIFAGRHGIPAVLHQLEALVLQLGTHYDPQPPQQRAARPRSPSSPATKRAA